MTVAAIARQYGITPTNLHNYVHRHFAKTMKAVAVRKEQAHELTLANRMERAVRRLEKLADAAEEELIDPDDPGKFTLASRSKDIKVRYETVRESDDKVVTRTASLHQLLEIVRRDLPIDVVKVEQRDIHPVVAMINSIKAFTPQMKLILDVYREGKEDQRMEQAVTEIWRAFQDALNEAVEDDEQRRLIGQILARAGSRLQSIR